MCTMYNVNFKKICNLFSNNRGGERNSRRILLHILSIDVNKHSSENPVKRSSSFSALIHIIYVQSVRKNTNESGFHLWTKNNRNDKSNQCEHDNVFNERQRSLPLQSLETIQFPFVSYLIFSFASFTNVDGYYIVGVVFIIGILKKILKTGQTISTLLKA